jgi:hypothetical protein
MKITRSQLKQLIKEEVTKLHESASKPNVSVSKGKLDQEKLSDLTRKFGQVRNVTPDKDESLEFIVTKDQVSGPDKGKKYVEQLHRRLVAYDHIPAGVELKVTYSN